jgi:DNA-binding LacI/PurR family transcriptional regulator
MRQDMPLIGQKATRMLLDIILHKNIPVQEMKLPAQLIVRQSTLGKGGE